jgi:hypothetical protein
MRSPTSDFIPVFAFEAQAVGTTDVPGATIVAPWRFGRKITFLWSTGPLAAADAFTLTYEARRKGTSTWDKIKTYDGTENLSPLAAAVADAGAIENGVIMSTIDLERLTHAASGANLGTTYEYDAIRAHADNADNTTPPILSCVAFIWDLYNSPAVDLSGNDVIDYTFQNSSGVGV